MNDAKSILLKILGIIGYSEDKEEFATEFLQNVSLQALLDLFNTLPQDKKDQLQQKITQKELKVYFSEEQIQQAIASSSKNAMEEYIKTIEPTLSDSQKENLANYFAEITRNAAPAATI